MTDLSVNGRNPVARKINRERIVVLGWGRAILMQLAHPLVAQGVMDHTSFSRRPDQYLRRAERTIKAMLYMTFGSDEEVRAAAARINGLHQQVAGTLDSSAGSHPAGRHYSARDPELLLWVHATLVDSLPLAYQHFVGPLTSAERDQYCVEAAGAAELLGLPKGIAPTSAAQVDAYMQRMLSSGQIVVTDAARTLAETLLTPYLGPAAPFFTPARLITIGLLPSPIREAYGFRWSERQARVFDRLVRMIRRTRPWVPPFVREWPMARRAA